MAKDKPSFFERLTGAVKLDESDERADAISVSNTRAMASPSVKAASWIDETAEEGELTVDVYQKQRHYFCKSNDSRRSTRRPRHQHQP